MNYDIIIIGSGLGGLTAGAKLAKSGKTVLMIEQHDRPGGCATTFKRKGFTMEVGLHEMDGLDNRDMKTKIFRDLGVFDEVEFLKVPEFYCFKNGNTEFVMPHDSEEAIRRLKEKYPKEESGIDAYFDQILNFKKINPEIENFDENLGDFLDRIISDEELKLVLLGNLGYFHDDPYTLSLQYYSVAQGSYFRGGGNFIKGGSQNLSSYLADFIEKNDGKVLLNHIVEKIIVQENKAIGVEFTNLKGTTSKVLKAYADDIIANNALPNIVDLLPEENQKDLALQIENKKIGASLLTMYFGFRKPLKELGSKHYSYFVYDDSVKSQKDIQANNKADFTKRSFTFVDYSQVDSNLAPAGKSVGAICCIDYTSDWENLNKEEYKQKKKEVAKAFLERMEKLIPGFKQATEYYEIGTAKTVERYTLNPKGAVYGFAQGSDNVFSEKIKTIDDLHIASAWGKIGGGFSGAIFSGYLCAFDLLRKR